MKPILKRLYMVFLFFVFIAVFCGVVFLLSLIPNIETIAMFTLKIIFPLELLYLLGCVVIWIITGEWRFFK